MRIFLILILGIGITFPIFGNGKNDSEINMTSKGVAIKGYDTVAYFLSNKPVKGDPQYSYSFKGALWYFSSLENKELFQTAPDKYIPKYGGYCAWAVAQNKLADINPKEWNIHEGNFILTTPIQFRKNL
jgi:YHS domain-containing protein